MQGGGGKGLGSAAEDLWANYQVQPAGEQTHAHTQHANNQKMKHLRVCEHAQKCTETAFPPTWFEGFLCGTACPGDRPSTAQSRPSRRTDAASP